MSIVSFLMLLLGFWFSVIEPAVYAQQNRRIISCDGPLAPDTNPAKLAQTFGAANVTTEKIHVGEGDFEEGTVLFAKSPADRLDILWTGGVTHGRPRQLFVRGEKGRWRTRGGLTLGASLQAVERFNRRPFRLLGFGWDYGGTTMDWLGGLLDDRPGPCRIGARFAPPDTAREIDGGKWYAQVMGDKEFSSGHPAMQALNPVIYEIFVQYRD